ncbi:enoyl-CoA hydratase/isomerase family protein [Pseudomonas sp.]|uniref:enoyl-CoA hydratase/isomerase family protein n=1 Tax=Pseudomonas sp. TaxID=306 RepID=UPI0028A8EB29|nr:enoyl-CoA hydratase/isomerase family protein [Pseudomonas sp.]
MTAQARTLEASHVLATVRNHIGHLTLNRPEGLNALTLGMVRSLQRQLDAWREDDQVKAVVLRGEGPKGFCAGGDIRALYDSYQAGSTLCEVFFEEEYALDLSLHRYSKPVVVLMDGFTLGGGMGLAQGCDLRVVTERSRLAMPEVGIGYFPDVGASYFLSRVPGELGVYLGVTGKQIQAADALYCGLANWYLPSAALGDFDAGLDRLQFGPYPLKDLQSLLAGLGQQMLEEAPLAELRPAIDHYFSQPDLPAIIEQLRAVNLGHSHAWALATADLLESRSPLAMAVTLQMLRRGRELGLEQCFAQELHVDRQWFEHGDLIEGVRALLIDKDKQPRWNPRTPGEVTAAQVSRFFDGL